MTGFYLLSPTVRATAHAEMDNPTVKKLWRSFTRTSSALTLVPCGEFVFRLGETPLPPLPAGKEYAFSADAHGIAVVGRDFGGLMRGFLSMLMKIEKLESGCGIRHTEEQSEYLLQNRMLHICIFPENDLYFIKKLIRLAALCQYTHIVIEFWGMLKYDCLPALSWPQAFTKETAGELIRECRELGIEPIPMFNQLGHATASRMCYGKHVVLDQDPSLEHLFTPDGWAWNIRSPEVRELLKKVRSELYDLFGEGQYMHIGCDEAYFISKNAELRRELPHYLQTLTHEVEQEGRRPMLWMDMLLEKDAFKDCYSVGEKDEVEAIRHATAKSSVFVDWQYSCTDVPIPSLSSLKDCGRDVMGAPWYNPKNYSAHIQTVSENGMHGIMLTTWHTLKLHMHSILGCARACGAKTFTWSDCSGFYEETATILRRVSFEGGSYSDFGWGKAQIDI